MEGIWLCDDAWTSVFRQIGDVLELVKVLRVCKRWTKLVKQDGRLWREMGFPEGYAGFRGFMKKPWQRIQFFMRTEALQRKGRQGRLSLEYEMFCRDPPPFATVSVPNWHDPWIWAITLVGPPGTLYEGGFFRVLMRFSDDYPFKPPRMTFQTKIYHPNIRWEDGCISVDVLQDCWSPALSASKLALSLCSLLSDPNPHSPLNMEAAENYRNNRPLFDEICISWTKQYATGDDDCRRREAKAQRRRFAREEVGRAQALKEEEKEHMARN